MAIWKLKCDTCEIIYHEEDDQRKDKTVRILRGLCKEHAVSKTNYQISAYRRQIKNSWDNKSCMSSKKTSTKKKKKDSKSVTNKLIKCLSDLNKKKKAT